MLTIKFNTGAVLPMRDSVAKSGNHYPQVKPEGKAYVGRGGFNLPIAEIGGKLPTSGELFSDGEKVNGKWVTAGSSLGSFTLEAGKTEDKGNDKVSGSDLVSFDYEGDEVYLSVRISKVDATRANSLIQAARKASTTKSAL